MFEYIKEIIFKGEKLDPNKNYCMDCGACCQYFKVYFPKKESSEFGGQVPKDYVEKYDALNINMIGRHCFNDGNKCKSLKGEIGKEVLCEIYQNRPSVCREFTVISEDGYQNPRCKRARRVAGLTAQLTDNIKNK